MVKMGLEVGEIKNGKCEGGGKEHLKEIKGRIRRESAQFGGGEGSYIPQKKVV